MKGVFHVNGPTGSGKTVLIQHALVGFSKEFPQHDVVLVDAFQLTPLEDVHVKLAQTFFGRGMSAYRAEYQL